MPKTVDHEQRRSQLARSLIRVADRDGLHAVTLRAVAAEAGVSLRLVQYYFASRAQLMNHALERLEAQSHARWQARLARLPRACSARAWMQAFLDEALPSDADSRTFHRVWNAYATLAMTDSDLARQPFAEGPKRLQRKMADALKKAQAQGELTATRDAMVEATRLLALQHGLATGLLAGQWSLRSARRVLRHHMDDLFDTRN